MKRKKIYIVSILVLVCMVFGAFYMPGIVLEVQDAKLLHDYEFRARNGIDYEALDLKYLTDRTERLDAFAKGIEEGRQYYIVSSEEQEADKDEVLVYTFENELSYLLQSVGILWTYKGLYDSRNLTDWDYYLIYSSDTENGVVIPCWYLELTIESQKVRVLIDAVDYTIYYMECYNDGIWDNYLANLKADGREWYDLSYDLLSLKSYYGGYSWGMEWAEAMGIDINEAKVSSEKEKKIIQEEVILSQYSIVGNSSEIVSELPFDNGKLTLDAGFLTEQDGMYGIGIGIKEILELLPEERRGTRQHLYG